MTEFFKEFAEYTALGLEVVAVIIIALGALEAAFGLMRPKYDPLHPFAYKKGIFLGFGVWLLLGLEFELGADIIRTAIAPTWRQIGELAAIAVIRTFLNHFLSKDIEKSAEQAPAIETAFPTREAREAMAPAAGEAVLPGRLNTRLG